MIYLYSGTPGSGKSCHQAEDILFNLKHGRFVIANYSINTDLIKKKRGYFYQLENDVLTPKNLIKLADWWFQSHKFKEGAIRLYIDESQILFNAREWQKSDRSEWLKFFSQHRKFGFNIYLIAQNDRMLDRQIRGVIEYECIHRVLSNFGFKGILLSVLFGGRTYAVVTKWYPMAERVSTEMQHILLLSTFKILLSFLHKFKKLIKNLLHQFTK